MTPAVTAIETRDGLTLYGCVLRPREVRAVVAMVHGHGEHIGRYQSLHRALTGAGFLVVAADLRGFGRSPGERGHLQRWDDMRRDADAIVAVARQLAGGAPVFAFGHGVGGTAVLDLAAFSPVGLAGVVASAPMLVADGLGVITQIARALARVAPRLGLDLGADPSRLSSLPEVGADLLDDPLAHRRMTMGWAAAVMAGMAGIAARPQAVRLPTLLLQGGEDTIGSVAATRAFSERIAHPDRMLRLYPGCRHEVHHDGARLQFERDLVEWIGARAAAAASVRASPIREMAWGAVAERCALPAAI